MCKVQHISDALQLGSSFKVPKRPMSRPLMDFFKEADGWEKMQYF